MKEFEGNGLRYRDAGNIDRELPKRNPVLPEYA